MTRTLGKVLQDAREAWIAQYMETGIYDPDWRGPCDEAAALSVREAVLLEAIEAVKGLPIAYAEGEFDEFDQGAMATHEECVIVLQRLMDVSGSRPSSAESQCSAQALPTPQSSNGE